MNTLKVTSACRDNTTDVGRIRPLWDPHHNQACYRPSTAETDRLLCDMYDYASRSAAEIVVVVIIIIIK